jgi:hypothetical protein
LLPTVVLGAVYIPSIYTKLHGNLRSAVFQHVLSVKIANTDLPTLSFLHRIAIRIQI